MLGYFRSQHANQVWLTAPVAIVDYATVVAITSKGTLKLQADLTAAMGRHVLSDIVVIFGLEQSLEKDCSPRLAEKTEPLRALLHDRAAIFNANQLSGRVAGEKV
jgi:hypothetical protein